MKTPPRPYKLVIREAIMAALFTKMANLAQTELHNLIRRNALVSNYTHLSFAYNGKFYSMEPEYLPSPPIRQRLHPSLLGDMKYYLDEFGYPLEMEKTRVEGYLTSMLAYSPLPGDYLLLLPAALHAVVQGAVTCDWSTDLSPEKIASFMAKYQSGYDLLRQRMAINLIL